MLLVSRPPGRPSYRLVATGLSSHLPFGRSAELAEHLGWSRSLLSNVKAGRRRVNDADATRIARFLGKTEAELFAPAPSAPSEASPSSSPVIPITLYINPETRTISLSDPRETEA